MRERKKSLLLAHRDRGVVAEQTRGTHFFCGGVVLVERGVSARAALREDEGYATG